MQPPASLKALGDPIYEAFYGLTEQPFAISTDPRFFYLSASHQRAFSELLNGLRRHESILLVTGETGTGKTTLCRAVLEALGDRTFSALILNPYMSGPEVLRIVLRDFGFVSHEDLRRGALASADVPQLLDALEGFLKSLQPLAGHAVIVIDEAQSLAAPILDQIRMLTALEHDHRRLVQVVLCGQPGLLGTIKSEPLHALNERITRRVELSPLTPEDVDGYIRHRLGVAGGGEAVRFDTAATLAVADLSRGLPRRINVLCDRALQEGRIEGVSVITTELVKRAARAVAGVHDARPVAPAAPSPAPTPVPADPSPRTPVPVVAAAEAVADTAPAASAATDTPSVEPTSDAPVPVDMPGLSFGHPAAEEDAPRRRAWKPVLAVVVLAAVLGISYVVWASMVGTPASAIPAPPTTRVLSGGALVAPMPVPSAAELEALLAAPVPVRRAPAVEPGGEGVVPPAGGPAPSGQNPDNSNQVN